MNNLNLYSYKGQLWIPAMHFCHDLTVALTVSSGIPCYISGLILWSIL